MDASLDGSQDRDGRGAGEKFFPRLGIEPVLTCAEWIPSTFKLNAILQAYRPRRMTVLNMGWFSAGVAERWVSFVVATYTHNSIISLFGKPYIRMLHCSRPFGYICGFRWCLQILNFGYHRLINLLWYVVQNIPPISYEHMKTLLNILQD
jgi:hypothetical protein